MTTGAERRQPYSPKLSQLVITNPTRLIHLAQERLNGTHPPVNYDPVRDIHTLGFAAEDNVVVIANGGDVSMNEEVVLYEYNKRGRSLTQEQGDRLDGPIVYPQTRKGDTLVYAEYSQDAPDPHYNARLLELIREGYATIGITLADVLQPVESITGFLQQSAPETYAPHVLSPRTLNEFHAQAWLHMGMYTKSGIEQICAQTGVPTPPTLNYPMNGDAAQVADTIAQHFPGYEDIVISKQSGCSGEGVFFVPKPDIEALIANQFSNGELMMIQGRIPKKHIINSPCFRAFIGKDRIVPIGVTVQRLVNGRYSGNTWHEGIEHDLIQAAPDFQETNGAALQAIQQAGVRGVVNIDYMLVTQEAVDEYQLPGTTLLRELNVRPAFSHPYGRIARGSIDGQPITQIQTNFGISVPDSLYYRENVLDILNTRTTPGIRIFLGLRYPSWAPSDPARSYIVFAANGTVSPEELDEVHEKTTALIANYN